MGLAAFVAALLCLGVGLWTGWTALSIVGIGLLAALIIGVLVIARPTRLALDRDISPPRVTKGSPAIALLTFANKGRGTIGTTVANQPFGDKPVRTVIPKMRRGERGVRSYRLPTSQRGVFDVGPVEVSRRDPFELFRTARRYGRTERIWVYPRVLDLTPLPVGQTRHLEGPSSDTSPQGNVTFHRLRDYVVGDDLRLVHWRSSARTGKLVVRHNVDTSQPFTVVLLDIRPSRYTPSRFESAIDVAASVLVSSSANKAPVELRLSDGTVLGGRRLRDVTPLMDHLTALNADAEGGLREQLLAIRRMSSGTSLVVVTGELDVEDLPYVAALRRRFDRLVVVSVDDEDRGPVRFPNVRIIVGADADAVRAAWNVGLHR